MSSGDVCAHRQNEWGIVHDAIQILLRKGPPVDEEKLVTLIRGTERPFMASRHSGSTPLHLAVTSGDAVAAGLLIRLGHPIAVVDKHDFSPLHLAAKNNDAPMMRLLISHGHPVSPRDLGGWMPLHRLTRSGSLEAAELLLQEGHPIDAVGFYQETPLHVAVRFQNLDLIRWLIVNGHDPDPIDALGRTPLHYAAVDRAPHIVELLLSLGADPLIQTFAHQSARMLLPSSHPLWTRLYNAELLYPTLFSRLLKNLRDLDYKTM